MMSITILSFIEQRNGDIKRSSYETLRKARSIADELGATVKACIIGDSVSEIGKEAGRYGASSVIAVNDKRLGHYSTTAYAKVITEIVKKENANILFFPASAMGKDLAPCVAARVDGAVAADCVELTVQNDDVTATKPIYAGKAMIDVTVRAPVKIFTLRPNVFPAGEPDGPEAGVSEIPVELTDEDFKSRVTDIVSVSRGKVDVTEADIIVSGGRGLKGPENFTLIEELAEVLGAAVGASRAVVDAGWRPHDEQVGQTGKTVSPALYIAVGISGAVQHLAGMSSSKYIVAINKDKDAPIFQFADYGIIGDALEIVPALTLEIKKLVGK
jgi:electron transfer flavoprotein alpha subunit